MSAPAMKPSEALRKARELITPEGAWIQGAICKDANDNSHDFGWYSKAVCWCAYGAMEAVSFKHWGGSLESWLKKVIGDKSIDHFNDDLARTHSEVLDAFDRAVALAEAKGQ